MAAVYRPFQHPSFPTFLPGGARIPYPFYHCMGALPGQDGHPERRPPKRVEHIGLLALGDRKVADLGWVKGRAALSDHLADQPARQERCLGMHSCHCLPKAGHRPRLEVPAPLSEVRYLWKYALYPYTCLPSLPALGDRSRS